MAFEVIVYFVPRQKRAQAQTTGSSPGDASVTIALAETAVWTQPRSFGQWPAVVQFTGSLPEAGGAPEITTIETPPSWGYRPFKRPFQPYNVYTAPPGDDSVAATPEYSQGRIPDAEFKQPYNPRRALDFILNAPLADDSVAPNTLADSLGVILRNVFRDDYVAYGYLGSPPFDESLDLDHFTRPVERPRFKEPFNPRRALDHLFNISFDDSEVGAAQPDQQGEIVVRTFRNPYNPRVALTELMGTPAYDDSFAVDPQEDKEAQSTIVRNTHQVRFDSRRAAVMFAGVESHDDSTAVVQLTGGVYIPTLRRRRR